MTSEQYRWEVKVIQDRYQLLGLTFEQAERVYEYEQVRHSYSDKHFFSAWEENDFELMVFRQILKEQQLLDYEQSLERRTKQYEQDLVDLDQNEIVTKEINL